MYLQKIRATPPVFLTRLNQLMELGTARYSIPVTPSKWISMKGTIIHPTADFKQHRPCKAKWDISEATEKGDRRKLPQTVFCYVRFSKMPALFMHVNQHSLLWMSTCKRTRLDPHILPWTKINSSWIKAQHESRKTKSGRRKHRPCLNKIQERERTF